MEDPEICFDWVHGCPHRSRDCANVAPGFSRCRCGQMFVFVSGGGCGRFKRVEQLTIADLENFDPAMAEDFRRFCGKPLLSEVQS